MPSTPTSSASPGCIPPNAEVLVADREDDLAFAPRLDDEADAVAVLTGGPTLGLVTHPKTGRPEGVSGVAAPAGHGGPVRGARSEVGSGDGDGGRVQRSRDGERCHRRTVGVRGALDLDLQGVGRMDRRVGRKLVSEGEHDLGTADDWTMRPMQLPSRPAVQPSSGSLIHRPDVPKVDPVSPLSQPTSVPVGAVSPKSVPVTVTVVASGDPETLTDATDGL